VSDHSPAAGEGREPDPDRIMTPQDFGRELTLLRHDANRTVRQVAKAAGLPVSTVGDYFGRPLTGPGSYVYSVTFSPDGKTLAAGVTDGTVWLWDLAVPAHPSLMATINGPNGHVYSVAFSPSGGNLAAGSADGTVRLWDTSAGAAAAAVCADAGQPISRLEWDNYIPARPYRAPCP
jgi:WD40 repeat protein